MAVRKQFEGIIHSRLDEAERFLQVLGRDLVTYEEDCFLEWMRVTDCVFSVAFGELSHHTRSYRTVVHLVQMERGLFLNRLAACVRRAKLEIVQKGVPNPELEWPAGWEVPEYLLNREAEETKRRRRQWWRWLW